MVRELITKRSPEDLQAAVATGALRVRACTGAVRRFFTRSAGSGATALFDSQFAVVRIVQYSLPLDRLLRLLMTIAALVMRWCHAAAMRLPCARPPCWRSRRLPLACWPGRAGCSGALFHPAWSAFLGRGLNNTLMVLGYLPSVFFTLYASQIGSALEVCPTE